VSAGGSTNLRTAIGAGHHSTQPNWKMMNSVSTVWKASIVVDLTAN
jgi:hypothetical protein